MKSGREGAVSRRGSVSTVRNVIMFTASNDEPIPCARRTVSASPPDFSSRLLVGSGIRTEAACSPLDQEPMPFPAIV